MAPGWLLAALTSLCFVEGLTRCITPNGKDGKCKSINECPPLRTIISTPEATRDQVTLLKRSTCGFQKDVPMVCCPLQPTPWLQERMSCLTPEGSPGQCVSIFDCKHVAERLRSPTVSQEGRVYVNSIRCPSTTGFQVCCGPPPSSFEPIPAPVLDQCVSSAAPPDPRTLCCGLDGTNSNKITEGNATAIDQYPWLALIEYKKDNKIHLLCGGALISGRYVLTAAHCVVSTLNPINVRLGEYDTANPGRDCVPVEGGEEGDVDCTVDPVIIGIEQVIAHPAFNPRSPLRRNDIAMLRLAKMAPYTYFVRPICLPTTDVTVDFPASAKLFAAGWGAISEKVLSSNLKLHADLPYKSRQTCQRAYLAPNRRVKLWKRQICAGGEDGKDSCKGDSGGPLMYSTGTVYEVVGIVSFGPTPCGLDNIPGVYTKVFEYLSWIRSHIRA